MYNVSWVNTAIVYVTENSLGKSNFASESAYFNCWYGDGTIAIYMKILISTH